MEACSVRYRMVMALGKRESLAAGDWTEAALETLARGGLAAVAVEPLAKSLGTTKGSFYWHFADRNALLEATLELWERRDTDRVLASIDESQDVATRLRKLLRPRPREAASPKPLSWRYSMSCAMLSWNSFRMTSPFKKS